MIYDCFIFFNELEILDIRLNTLNSAVDKFVICESTVDHKNRPKPLYFAENRQKFKKFENKIIYVKVGNTPKTHVPWVAIDHQWNGITEVLKKCKQSDIILLSDVDEIPNPEKIAEWKDKPGKIKVFMQSLSYYYLNCVDYAEEVWEGTRMARYKDIKGNRIWASKFLLPDAKIQNGGWHFSYIGDIKRIQLKVASSGHQEFNTEDYKTYENIKMAIAEGRDFLKHGLKFKIADKSFLPKYVLDNQSKFEELLIDKFEKESLRYSLGKIYLSVKHNLRLFYRKIRRYYLAEKKFFKR